LGAFVVPFQSDLSYIRRQASIVACKKPHQSTTFSATTMNTSIHEINKISPSSEQNDDVLLERPTRGRRVTDSSLEDLHHPKFKPEAPPSNDKPRQQRRGGISFSYLTASNAAQAAYFASAEENKHRSIAHQHRCLTENSSNSDLRVQQQLAAVFSTEHRPKRIRTYSV